jgi:hypothetical protein
MKFVTTETAGQLDSQGLHRVRERLVRQRTGRAPLLESRRRCPAGATLLAARTAAHFFKAGRLALTPHAARRRGIHGGLASARSSTNGAGPKYQLLQLESQSATTQNGDQLSISTDHCEPKKAFRTNEYTGRISDIGVSYCSGEWCLHFQRSLSLDAGMRLAKRAQHGGSC